MEQIFQYELIPGLRASSKLLCIKDEEQIFIYKYSANDIKYYYCYKKTCKAGVAVDCNNTKTCRKSRKSQDHNHGSQRELIEKFKVINEIKYKVKNVSAKRSSVRETFEEQCKKFKEASNTLEFGKMRRQLYNIKQKSCPNSSQTFTDIIDMFKNKEVLNKFGMSRYESGKEFYVDTVITNYFSYTLFVSPTISKAIQSMSISEPRNYVFDATVNVVSISKEFKQLLIIHIIHGDHSFPFIYALMSRKTEEAYSHMLQYLRLNKLDLQPITVIADYENALRNAIKNVYPTAKIVACWFHYSNALRRRASKIPGFIKQLNSDYQAKLFFNKFLYLPLLKPNDITAAYKTLKRDAMDAKYIKENMSESYFESFIKYFESYWMEKETVTNFSVYKEKSIRRSNTAEDFHSQLNTKLPKHSNIYRFLDSLCDLDATKSSDFLKCNSYCPFDSSPNKHIYQQRNTFIQKQYQLLREKKITLNTLLAQFSTMQNCLIEENFINIIDSNDDESNQRKSDESDESNSEE